MVLLEFKKYIILVDKKWNCSLNKLKLLCIKPVIWNYCLMLMVKNLILLHYYIFSLKIKITFYATSNMADHYKKKYCICIVLRKEYLIDALNFNVKTTLA